MPDFLRAAERIVPLGRLDERLGDTIEAIASMRRHNGVRAATANLLDEFSEEIRTKAYVLADSGA